MYRNTTVGDRKTEMHALLTVPHLSNHKPCYNNHTAGREEGRMSPNPQCTVRENWGCPCPSVVVPRSVTEDNFSRLVRLA